MSVKYHVAYEGRVMKDPCLEADTPDEAYELLKARAKVAHLNELSYSIVKIETIETELVRKTVTVWKEVE